MQNLIKPSTDFRSVRDGRNSPVYYVDVDLTNARNAATMTSLVLPISGNSFYINANPNDGNAFVHFQDTNFDNAPAPLYVSPGSIFNIPFTQVMIENTAQPGKKIRIVYGIDVDFQPGSVSQISVTNAGGYTAIRPEQSTGNYKSQSALAINTAETIFTPAANVNGAILLSGQIISSEAASHNAVFVAKNSAPSSIIDGEVILSGMYTQSVNSTVIGQLNQPLFIGAGLGLYFIASAAQTAANGFSIRHARYKLL